ncbi:hypothetical protein FD06_GL000306 [Apilactobacillus ozensis DSM 23829 = JCM 17196]|uniref:Uncharacterized protein n=1 Tax=Apilactobacillus ozensis DSM 23829 = JCM 17196 TaxID=1423781 RepID=A0A0R2ARK6_9LACO|nr:hypothetical protein [Apilactobacillus ozensis]KRM69247.1 hypothetical protein FD06_GL000306 [Apilactobacillus ozensis DSM 23829 = JCM 17196]
MSKYSFNENKLIGLNNEHFSKKEDFVMNLSKNLCKAYGVDFNAFPIQKNWISDNEICHKELLHRILTEVIKTAYKTHDDFKLNKARG